MPKHKKGEANVAKKKKDPKLARAGVEAYNKPKRTPNHPSKSHVVVAKYKGGQMKTKTTALVSKGLRPQASQKPVSLKR